MIFSNPPDDSFGGFFIAIFCQCRGYFADTRRLAVTPTQFYRLPFVKKIDFM